MANVSSQLLIIRGSQEKKIFWTMATHTIDKKIILLLFFYDNAKPHTARMTQEQTLEFAWCVFPHPPYSPDFAATE